MDLRQIIDRFRGVTVTITTTSVAAPFATGEVLDGNLLNNILAIKLTAAYDGLPAGATVFFNPAQIVSIG
ncbi:MAG: hypothetical protein Q8930_08960 [Bacillota bacterium]|nr:hypothetical protein [Bacillota bacterium]